jgi:hypothetical protein
VAEKERARDGAQRRGFSGPLAAFAAVKLSNDRV